MKYLQFVKNFMKIGPVDPEIIGLKGIIKIEINASRTYSPVGQADEINEQKLSTFNNFHFLFVCRALFVQNNFLYTAQCYTMLHKNLTTTISRLLQY